jgi:hypothetical protein
VLLLGRQLPLGALDEPPHDKGACAMGDIITASGSKIYIGPAVVSTVDTVPEFAALSAYTEIGSVESLGEYGDESNIVTGANLADSRMQKAKGVRDAGTLALVCFHDPIDTGQAAIENAEATNDNYAFKVVLSDGPAGYSDTIQYFRAIVASKRKNVGNADNIIRNTYNIAINSAIYTDPAST